jgi:cytochrome c oxidase assembly protein subunit 15
MAYLLILAIFGHWALSRLRREQDRQSVLSLRVMALAVLAQAAIGIWTLLAQVPISLGLIHQAGALVLLAAALIHLHHASLSQAKPEAVAALSPRADLR